MFSDPLEFGFFFRGLKISSKIFIPLSMCSKWLPGRKMTGTLLSQNLRGQGNTNCSFRGQKKVQSVLYKRGPTRGVDCLWMSGISLLVVHVKYRWIWTWYKYMVKVWLKKEFTSYPEHVVIHMFLTLFVTTLLRRPKLCKDRKLKHKSSIFWIMSNAGIRIIIRIAFRILRVWSF